MKTERQNKQILEHLQRGLSIAPLEALRKYKILRLGARIHNLREEHPVVTRMIKLPSGKWVARYRLIKAESVVLYQGEFNRVDEIKNSSEIYIRSSRDSILKKERTLVSIKELS